MMHAPALLRAAVAAWLAAGAAAMAAEPQPADFAWRATLQTPPGASLVRVALPAEALARLQSAQAHDVRVFDAAGKPVPFALAQPAGQAAPARQPTARFPALPLSSAQAGARPPRGAMEVRVQDGGAQRQVWVHVAGPAAPAGDTARLPSVLFDTRAATQTIAAVAVQARLRPNAPTRVTLWASKDLAQWEPVPLRGSLFRFEGEGAPHNDTLELQAPLKLQGLYLRLDWAGQDGVAVESLTGLVAPPTPPVPPVTAPLAPGRPDGPSALEWEPGFRTPLRALHLSTAQPHVLLPVRVLGRDQASQPWRLMGQTVVYRLEGAGPPATNAPLPIQAAAPRWLRVEATHGMRLEGIALTAEVSFEPLDIVFVAGAQGPYRLAAGARDAAAAALPLAMIAATVDGRIEALPSARIERAESAAPAAPGALARMLPAGVDTRSALLWAVLLGGVLLLGAVAWSLLRHLGREPPAP